MTERRAAPPGARGTRDPLHSEWSIALRDDLAGRHARRLGIDLLRDHWDEVVAFHGQITLMLLDLECITEIKETYGELVGDRVLKTVVSLLRQHLRAQDFVIRQGETDFVLIFPGAGPGHARELEARVRQAMAAHPFFAKGSDQAVATPIAFELGMASCPAEARTGEQLLDLARKRLQDAKEGLGSPAPLARTAPRRHRPLLVGSSAAGGLLVVLGTLCILWRGEPEAVPTPTASAPPPAALPAPVRLRTVARERDRAQLEAYVAKLEERVRTLSRALGEEGAERDQAPEETIRDLQEKIQLLQEQLDAGAGDGSPGAPVGAAPDPGTGGRVRASQDQPLVARDGVAEGPAVDAAPGAPHPQLAPPAVLTRPILVRWTQPTYPPLAMRLGREAVVRVRVLVDEKGKVVLAEPLDPKAGLGFEEAARRAALEAVYRPGTRNGVPVEMETVIAVRFELKRDDTQPPGVSPP